MSIKLEGVQTHVQDDEHLTFGNDSDNVLVHRSAVLTTNTALTGVLEGTPVTPALPVNSLILSNTTADGDMMFATVDGGNSKSFMWMDGSAERLGLFATENAAAFKVQIGEAHSNGTQSLYREALFVYGGDGGSTIARFQRRTGSENHVVDIQASAGDPQITFTRSLGAGPVHYSIGQDATGTKFKIVKDVSLYAQSTQSAGSGTSIMEANLTVTVFNEDGIDQDFRIEGDSRQNLFFINAGDDRIGINTASPAAQLHIDHDDASGAVPVLLLDQADTDKPFIKFIGTGGSADATSIVDAAYVPSEAGYVMVEVDDITDTLTDGTYWIQLFSLAAP